MQKENQNSQNTSHTMDKTKHQKQEDHYQQKEQLHLDQQPKINQIARTPKSTLNDVINGKNEPLYRLLASDRIQTINGEVKKINDRRPTHKLCFLSCGPFVVNATFSKVL